VSNHTIPCALRLQTLPPYLGSSVAMCPTAPNPASQLRRAPVLPRVTRLRILPPYPGSGIAMCPTAPNPASQLRRAPVLPRVTRLRILPPYPGSGIAMCPTAPDHDMQTGAYSTTLVLLTTHRTQLLCNVTRQDGPYY
jgi:hypothetical protein